MTEPAGWAFEGPEPSWKPSAPRMQHLTGQGEYTRIRLLPVFAELVAVHGEPPFEHLSGAPVRVHQGAMRLPWLWFVDGENWNLAVDHAAGRWTVRAAGRYGHVVLTLKAGERVTSAKLRAAAVAVGLLD